MALLLIAGSYVYLSSKLPQSSREISLPGLKSEVDIVFDEWVISHKELENELDAYHALGYLLVQKNNFLLELMIRVARGRLYEMLG